MPSPDSKTHARAELVGLLESQLNTLEKETFGCVTEAELCEYEDRRSFILLNLCSCKTNQVLFVSACVCHVWVHYLGRIDHSLEFVFSYKSQLQCSLL